MQQEPIYVYEQDYVPVPHEKTIVEKMSQIRISLEKLAIKEIEGQVNVAPIINLLDHFVQIENLVMNLPKSLQHKYKRECQNLVFMQAQHMLSLQAQVKPQKAKQITFSDSVDKFLPQSNFLDFPKIFEVVAFQRTLAKLRFKKDAAENGKQYLQASANHFEDIVKEQLVNDSCVGCNSFFYQYHPIETIINPKRVPIYFAYHSSQEAKLLQQKNILLKVSPKQKIDLLNLQQDSSVKNFLRLIEKVLNKKGGYIIFGSHKMHKINQNELMPQLQSNLGNCASLKEVNLVVGELLSQKDQERIRQSIERLIEKVLPPINMDEHIQLRFLPVKGSRFNNGYFLNNIFKPVQRQDRWVVLIAVKPKAASYQIVGQAFQESAFQYPEEDYLDDDFYYHHAKVQYRRIEEVKQIQVQEEDELEGFLQSAKTSKYFDGHVCTYEKMEQ